MAVFSGEETIKVKFKNLKVPVGYGMTSAIIKHKCVEQATNEVSEDLPLFIN